MENKKKDVDLIACHINNAVQIGNSKAATAEAEEISKHFILIRKSDLPNVETQQVWSSVKCEAESRPVARTVAFRSKEPNVYLSRALDFLAMAQHTEQVKQAEERDRLIERQKEAWKLLNPDNPGWDYTVLPAQAKAQVDVVVGLLNQVDELKANK